MKIVKEIDSNRVPAIRRKSKYWKLFERVKKGKCLVITDIDSKSLRSVLLNYQRRNYFKNLKMYERNVNGEIYVYLCYPKKE